MINIISFILVSSQLVPCKCGRSVRLFSLFKLQNKSNKCLRWLLLGGYTNVEGGPHTRPLDTGHLLTLDQEGEGMMLVVTM